MGQQSILTIHNQLFMCTQSKNDISSWPASKDEASTAFSQLPFWVLQKKTKTCPRGRTLVGKILKLIDSLRGF